MSTDTTDRGLHCGALGCRDPAEVVIVHPRHGQRTVCSDCAGDYEVIYHV